MMAAEETTSSCKRSSAKYCTGTEKLLSTEIEVGTGNSARNVSGGKCSPSLKFKIWEDGGISSSGPWNDPERSWDHSGTRRAKLLV